MSSQKLALILISCIAIAALAGFLIWFFCYRQTTEKGSQEFTTVTDKFIPAAKEVLGLDADDKVKMLVAGLNVFRSLSHEDFKKIKNLKDEEKLKETIKKVEESKTGINDFLKLEDKEKIKEKSGLQAVNYLLSVINETVASIDVSKKEETPFKEIIERILKENEKQKDILSKAIDKYKASILEIVVCNTDLLVKLEQDPKDSKPVKSTEEPKTTPTNPSTTSESAESSKSAEDSAHKTEPTSKEVSSTQPSAADVTEAK